jgi:fluoride exporter
MKEMLWIGVGGFAGANARYLLGIWIAERLGAGFPYGTFVINITGSFALGLLIALIEDHGLPPVVRLSLATGFLGAYTTFSTFTFETLRLENGNGLLAVTNALGSVGAGLLAGSFGVVLGRML